MSTAFFEKQVSCYHRAGQNWIDGDPTTLSYAGSSTEFLFNFDSPKDLRRVRIASSSTENFSLEGIYVKYKDAADYTRVAGSSLGYFENDMLSNYQTIFEGSGYFAKNVVSAYIKAKSCGSNNWRFPVGEVEIDGRTSSAARPGFVIIVH